MPAYGLAALLGTSGCLHLAAPGPYRRIVPRSLRRWDAEVVAVSGVAEIVCAGLLVTPRTRRAGGLASAALFAAVFPANVRMALDGGYPDAPFPVNSPVAAWLRLPLQLPLVLAALRVSRGGERSDVPVRMRGRGRPVPA